jgi:nucleotide-binding universal stress UspA family protein
MAPVRRGMTLAALKYAERAMIEINAILCPVDRSEVSRRALIVGAELARWYGARLRVLEVAAAGLPPAAASPSAVAGLTPALRRAILDELQRFAACADGVATDVVVEEGDVVTRILAEASARATGLIVMGTHGRSGVERLVAGSITEKVLRQAPCPVLTVPPGQGAVPPGPGPFKSILCAVDFSQASTHAVQYALSLAQEADARLVVAHVVDWPNTAGLSAPLAAAINETRRDYDARRLEQLRAAVPASAREWCRVEEILATGTPGREIVRLANTQAIDLIVMGVHGRSALNLAIFGSTTRQVVHDAHCPVLTVPAACRTSDHPPLETVFGATL